MKKIMLRPDQQYAGLSKNDILICKKKYKYSRKNLYLNPGDKCLWSSDVYGKFRIIMDNTSITISESQFKTIAEHFYIDASYRLSDSATLTITQLNGSIKKYVESKKKDDITIGINTSFRQKENDIKGYASIECKWYTDRDDSSKQQPFYKQVAVAITNPLFKTVDIDVSEVTDGFKYDGLKTVESLTVKLNGYSAVPCKLKNIDGLTYIKLIGAHMDKIVLNGQLNVDFKDCIFDEVEINEINEKLHKHGVFSDCSIGKIVTAAKTINRYDFSVPSNSYSDMPLNVTLLYDTNTECALIVTNDKSIYLNKEKFIEALMIMQWHDAATILGVDISIGSDILSKVKPKSYYSGSFFFDDASTCDIEKKCAVYKIAPMINAVNIIEGTFKFNGAEWALYFDGENYHTLNVDTDAITKLSVHFQRPVSKKIYLFLFDRFKAVYGEDFMQAHMFLHMKQPGTLFDVMPLTEIDYPFNENFEYELNVSKVDFSILPDTVSAIVNTKEGIKIVDGPVVDERFGGFELLTGSKLVDPKEYPALKDFKLYWDLLIHTQRQQLEVEPKYYNHD